VSEKTRRAKGHAPPLNALEYFLERVHNEPEHAAYFAKKTPTEMAYPLGNHYGRLSICHVGKEVAPLRDGEKDKVVAAKR
jgi:hypothetical protein